jgi:hypothetical protein
VSFKPLRRATLTDTDYALTSHAEQANDIQANDIQAVFASSRGNDRGGGRLEPKLLRRGDAQIF